MEIPLLNASSTSLSPKALHSLTKREKSTTSQVSTGLTHQSTDVSMSQYPTWEIEEIKEQPSKNMKKAPVENIELQDIKPTASLIPESDPHHSQLPSESGQPRGEYTPAESMHLLQVAQRHVKTCILIFQTAFVLVIISMVLIVFSCIVTSTISFQIGMTLAFSLISAIVLRFSYAHLRANFPTESSEESSRIIFRLFFLTLFLIYWIGGAGAGKIEIDIMGIVDSFSAQNEMSQNGRILMQDLMTTLLAYFVLLGLFIFFNFLIAFIIALTIIHLILAVFTCCNYSLLGKITSSFARMWRRVLNKRLAVLEKYRSILIESEDRSGVTKQDEPCQICLEKFEAQQTIYRLPCETVHSFHEECLEKWAARSNICPSCRKPFSEL